MNHTANKWLLVFTAVTLIFLKTRRDPETLAQERPPVPAVLLAQMKTGSFAKGVL